MDATNTTCTACKSTATRNGVQPLEQCHYCAGAISPNDRKCATCGALVKKFDRLCTDLQCKKVVEPPTDNHCPAGHALPTYATKNRLYSHVRCRGCGFHTEYDDLMWFLLLPLIFQTLQGVKVNCFPGGDDINERAIKAARTFKKFFTFLDHDNWWQLSEDEVVNVLTNDDTRPWTFRSSELAIAFLSAFPCKQCMRKGSWELSTGEAMKKIAKENAPAIVVAVTTAASWLWKGLKVVGRDLASDTDNLRKKRGKK